MSVVKSRRVRRIGTSHGHLKLPVLFLDMDGAGANSTRWLFEQETMRRETESNLVVDSRKVDHIDPACVARLNRIQQATGCEFVLSSAWRIFGVDAVQDMLAKHGFVGRLIGGTPKLWGSRSRGNEISEWIDAESFAGTYVVLDDSLDAGVGHESRFVRTHRGVVDFVGPGGARGRIPDDGITDADVEKAIEILRRPR